MEKKRKKSFKRILKHKIFRMRNLFSLLSTLVSIILIVFVIIMNVLPVSYVVVISIILLLINFIAFCLINVHKKIILKIIGGILLFLNLVCSCIGLYYLTNTNNFINKSFTKNSVYDKNTYYVVALKDLKLKETDINGSIGVYSEMIHHDKALDKLNKKYPVKEKNYNDIALIFDSVLNKNVKFILVEKASYEIVFSISDKYNKDDFSVIYEFDLYTKKNKSKSINTEKFNVFIGGEDFAGLMDFNMIASINTKTHKILLTNIPRDYYIEVYEKDGRKDKLSFMNAYGEDISKKSLEKLFDIDIDYTVIINTDSLVEIVDYVGGIDFCSDYSFVTTHALVKDTYNDKGKKLNISKGCQHLNGIETLAVARERNAFPGRDRVRQKNCSIIMIEIFKELFSGDNIIHYNETLNTLSSLYETDLNKEIFSNFSKDLLKNGNKWQIDTSSVDGNDTHDKVHLSNMIDWVMYPDYKSVDTAKNKINKTLK